MINYDTKYVIIIVKPYTVILQWCAFHCTCVVSAIFFALVRSVQFFCTGAVGAIFCRTGAVQIFVLSLLPPVH